MLHKPLDTFQPTLLHRCAIAYATYSDILALGQGVGQHIMIEVTQPNQEVCFIFHRRSTVNILKPQFAQPYPNLPYPYPLLTALRPLHSRFTANRVLDVRRYSFNIQGANYLAPFSYKAWSVVRPVSISFPTSRSTQIRRQKVWLQEECRE